MATQYRLSENIVIQKDSGESDWEVLKNGETVGWLYKEHHSGTGRASWKWTGYVAPYDTWNFQPEDIDAYGEKQWDSFKKAKEGIPGYVQEHELTHAKVTGLFNAKDSIHAEFSTIWDAGGDPGADIDPVELVERVAGQFGLDVDRIRDELMALWLKLDQEYTVRL